MKKVWKMFKANNKSPEWRRSGVFIVNFKHSLHLFFSVCIVDFEQMLATKIAKWEK